jgi:hypothetical protein
MSCPTSIAGTPSESPKTFANWARNVEFTTRQSFRPTTRGEVVEIIRTAEADPQGKVKWAGSRWSFMPTFVTEDIVIESDDIFGLVEINLGDSDINQRRILSHLSLSPNVQIPFDEGLLVHIKGGTKIFNVNRLLHGLPILPNRTIHPIPDDEAPAVLECLPNSRAMPTLGGSGGQSIAGAISTGTHGGDIGLSPIADAVVAIHLIGPGGQEWWIERSAGITAGTEEDTRLELEMLSTTFPDAGIEICRDIIVKKDDTTFNAVMVSLGRMGFIYSLVVKVEKPFKLKERRRDDIWETFRANLTSLSSLRNFDAAHPDTRLQVSNIHYLNILIMPFRNSSGQHVCKIATREKFTPDIGDNCMGLPPTAPTGGGATDFGGTITSWMCKLTDVRTILLFLIPLLATLVASAGLLAISIGVLASIPFFGWALAAAAIAALAALTVVITALTGLIGYLTFSGSLTSRELIAAISDFAFRFGFREIMIDALIGLFNSVYAVTRDGEPKIDTAFSWKIMDTYGYNGEDFCEKADSMDFGFDAFLTNSSGLPVYFDFIDGVLQIFEDLRNRNIVIAGNLALRYSSNTSSFLGMSRFPTTCHIEIAALRGFAGNTEFIERVQLLAKSFNAVPSWGQLINHYNALDISRIHGINLVQWRRVLTNLIRVGGGRDFTFSNNFTQAYNLEPFEDTPISSITVDLLVGGDSLGDTDWIRHDVSQDFLFVRLRSSATVEISLNENTTWNAFTTHSRRIDLPLGTVWGDVLAVGIRHIAAGNDWNADNWTMDRIVISSITPTGGVMERFNTTGTPIHQFQKNANQIWEHSFE